MHCPYCHNDNTKVLESRSTEDGNSIRRRRECFACEQRFTTYERLEQSPVVVVKSSGSKEIYSRDKLVASIYRSCSKSQLSASTVDTIVSEVETELSKLNGREVSSSVLGTLVLQALKKADSIAYIRYSSIFKKFTNISEFIAEIKGLEDQLLGIEYEYANASKSPRA